MPDHAETFLRQAQSFLHAQQPKEALRLLAEARMLARDDRHLHARVLSLQGEAWAMLGENEKAIDSLRKALDLDPSLGLAISSLADRFANRAAKRFAADLRSLLRSSPNPGVAKLSRRPRRTPVLAALALTTAAGSLAYFGVIPFGFLGSQEGRNRLDIARIRNNVGLVVVSAECSTPNGKIEYPLGTGTCFAVSADGYLLTNRHVTEARSKASNGCSPDGQTIEIPSGWRLTVYFGPLKKDQFDAKLVHESVYRDFALLKIERQFPRFFRPTFNWQQGDEVYAVGFPGKVHDLLRETENPSDSLKRATEELSQSNPSMSRIVLTESDYEVTVTRGVISASRRIDNTQWVQTDAGVSEGNSGGPLIAPTCEVVGINTGKHKES